MDPSLIDETTEVRSNSPKTTKHADKKVYEKFGGEKKVNLQRCHSAISCEGDGAWFSKIPRQKSVIKPYMSRKPRALSNSSRASDSSFSK